MGSIQQPAPKPPLEDGRDDEHGNIYWKSTAMPKYSGYEWLWEYTRIVNNRHERLKCRVNWEPAQFKSLIPPQVTVPAGQALTDIPPDRYDGKILYNGGPAAGDGSAEAPVWDPKNQVPKDKHMVAAAATVIFGFQDVLYRVTLTADTEMFRVSGVTPPEYKLIYTVKSANISKLPQAVRIRWDSVESQEFVELIGKENMEAGSYLRFEGTFFRQTLTTKNRPVFRDQSIRFLDRKDNVLAQAWLPALAPPAK